MTVPSENAVIKALCSLFPEHIGDDAALLDSWVISKDLLVEDVHFRTRYTPPCRLAHKMLHVNMSDMAAMGAIPYAILWGCAVPPSYENRIMELVEHTARLCKAHDVILLGGDTTGAPDKLCLSVTVLGKTLPLGKVKKRCGGRPGDLLYVCGHLGLAHVGYLTCESLPEMCVDPSGTILLGEMECLREAVEVFQKPMARVKEGAFFAQYASVHAMMDLSDGLWEDVHKLAERSGVQARLSLQALETLSQALAPFCEKVGCKPWDAVLAGGEDYSLLVAIDPQKAREIEEAFFATFQQQLLPVGSLSSGSGVHIYDRQGCVTRPFAPPFQHFQHFQHFKNP